MQPMAIAESKTLIADEKPTIDLQSPVRSDELSQEALPKPQVKTDPKEKEKKSGSKHLGEFVESGFASVAASITDHTSARLAKSSVKSSDGKIIAKLDSIQAEQAAATTQQTAVLQSMIVAFNSIVEKLAK